MGVDNHAHSGPGAGPGHSPHPRRSVSTHCAGFLHADLLLELLRPRIDRAVLPWVAEHGSARADFPVTRAGIARVHRNLTLVFDLD